MIIFGCAFAPCQSQGKKPTKTSKDEQQIASLNRLWADSITNADRKGLERLFADDIFITSGAGEIRDKQGEIKNAIGDGGPPDPDFISTRPFTTEDVRLKVYKDAAVVTGLARWGFKYKGQEVNQERRYTHTYVMQKGQWRIVPQQISTNLYKNRKTHHKY